MCGIAGFSDPTLSRAESEITIQRMLEKISHRGPDGRGTWFNSPLTLGHNRLSIIDLSADGNQPMHFFDSALTFNGEIYNYLELREELKLKGYRFVTQSDTEVVMAAWREYGEKCVNHFVGMWAFVLWDKKEEVLFCSRDRFGIKPFYYIHQGDRFYFGSEYKALKESPLFSPEFNWASVSRGLQLGWNSYADETYFKQINSLPAACNLVFRNGKVTVHHYWEIETRPLFQGSFEEKSKRFTELFSESIRLHMRSDVEVGGCLSGGLDSSSIASSVASQFPKTKFKTFTIFYSGDGGVDERPWVQEVIEKYPQLEPYYLNPSDDDIAESFDRAIYHADVPIAGSSPVSQYFVMQLAAREKIKVILDGQGSDEYLAGYMHSFYRLIGGQLRKFKIGSAIHEWNQHARRQNMTGSKKADVLMKSVLSSLLSEQQLYSLEYRNYYPFLSHDQHGALKLPVFSGSPLKQFLYQLITNTSLPTLLQFEDRNSMAFSIESRVPFLDHRLVEFIFTLSDEDLIHEGETKRILRHALRGILPPAIANRSDKKGFVTPGEVKWLRGPLKFLLDGNFQQLDIMNLRKIRELISDFKKGDDRYANLVWRVAVLNYWMSRNY